MRYANPQCNASLRRLSEGKLFQFEARQIFILPEAPFLKGHSSCALLAVSEMCHVHDISVAEEYTDPFTLQYVAGHDNIKTTMRYVHSREAAVHKLFERLADLQRSEERSACNVSVQNPVQLGMPSQDELVKLLITGNLQSAEVVELADTPS